MVFIVEHRWDCGVSAVVILGAGRATIPCRRRIGEKDETQPRILFVNSLAGAAYGSTSMDCHYALHSGARRVANLYGQSSATAASADSCRAVSDARDC